MSHSSELELDLRRSSRVAHHGLPQWLLSHVVAYSASHRCRTHCHFVLGAWADLFIDIWIFIAVETILPVIGPIRWPRLVPRSAHDILFDFPLNFDLLLDRFQGLLKQFLIPEELLSQLVRVGNVRLNLVRHQLTDRIFS